MKVRSFFTLCVSLLTLSLYAATPQTVEPFEGKPTAKIHVSFENQAPGEDDETGVVLNKMRTKTGEPFDQDTFDSDLKVLSEEYDWVEPHVRVTDGKVYVSLVIKKKPIVTKFSVSGTSFSTKKILSEAELEPGVRYDRENFYKAVNRIRDFLTKKGYFKSEITYEIEGEPNSNEVTVHITIHEGPKGRINEIVFDGFTNDEEKAVLNLIRSKKFNVLTSWITGSGTIKEEEIDPDIQTIVHYMQNQGYVDAHVTMQIEELPDNKLGLVIHLTRGEKYYLHDITFSGYALKDAEELKKAAGLQPGDVFSVDKIQEAQEKIRHVYTEAGYIHTQIDYELKLVAHKPEYDIHFTVEESNQYRVGLVMVTGNYSTNKNVVYNNIDIEPGDVFDSRKLKSTQDRLQSTGYFKTVNVYPVKGEEDSYGNSEYCDVMVEVNEAQTGSASVFVGFSSTDSILGGIDFTENNFSIAGFRNVWSEGMPAFRGGGQYLQVKGTMGIKENGANISWMDPYIFDTLWRFGVDLEYSRSKIISDDYTFYTFGSILSASYPVSPYFNAGSRFRVKNGVVHIKAGSPPLAAEQSKNNGIVTGLAATFGYDTTDNTFKPHRGIRSSLEGEVAGLIRKIETLKDFPFLRTSYLNSFYYPVWRKGTLKMRGDFKFITPLMGATGESFPLTERFFLGGVETVRGYSPGKVGKSYGETKGVTEEEKKEGDDEPVGGLSSILLSAEYSQNIFKPLDLFVFVDAGSITLTPWNVDQFAITYGIGARLDIGRQLPFVFGVGFPFKKATTKSEEAKLQTIFFSMAGQF